jgi:flagellin
MDKSIERLSSGLRINSARDDAAGMAIAGRMESQIRGLQASVRNAKDAQSLVATSEGAMNEITEILQRMRELAVQASSGIATGTDKDYLDLEMTQLVAEIDGIATNTKFNNQQVLKGSVFSFYNDINITGTTMDTPAADMATSTLVVQAADVNIDNQASAILIASAIGDIDAAISTVTEKRAALGAISNRLDHTIDNLTNIIMNTIASKSRIEDADFAAETTRMTRNSVLQQAATSMLAQANASKQTILSLIQQ